MDRTTEAAPLHSFQACPAQEGQKTKSINPLITSVSNRNSLEKGAYDLTDIDTLVPLSSGCGSRPSGQKNGEHTERQCRHNSTCLLQKHYAVLRKFLSVYIIDSTNKYARDYRANPEHKGAEDKEKETEDKHYSILRKHTLDMTDRKLVAHRSYQIKQRRSLYLQV